MAKMTIEQLKKERLKRMNNRFYLKGIKKENNLQDAKIIGCFKKFPDVKLSSRVEDLDPNEKMSCLYDKAFKTLIANPNKPEVLAKFLSLIYETSYEEILSNLRLSRNEFYKVTIDSTGYRGDLVVEIGNNIVILEDNQTWAEERNLKYLDSYLSTKLLLEHEHIIPSSCVLINLNYYTYEGHNKTVERYLLTNEDGELLTFCKVVIDIFIPNILEKYYNGDGLNELERVVLILVLTNMEHARELADDDEILLDFIEYSKIMEKDEQLVAEYNKEIERREMPMLEIYDEGHDNGFKEGRTEGLKAGEKIGLEKGRAEGRAEGKTSTFVSIIKGMLKKRKKLRRNF